MPDNTVLNPGADGDVARAVEKGGAKTQAVVLDVGGADEEKLLDTNNPMPVMDTDAFLLRALLRLLKPLGQVTGGGSNRLSIDLNSGAVSITSGTVTTVTTVAALTNLISIGGIAAFQQMKDQSRSAYAAGIRSRLS